MATQQQINVSPVTDEDRAIATITMAFSNDPVVRWVLRDAHLYLTYWPPFVKAFAGAAFANGTADSIDDCGGVALWLPPGVESDEETMGALVAEAVPASQPGGGLRLPRPDGRVPPHRTPLVPAAHRRRRHKAGPRTRIGAAAPCARTLRPGSTARLPRGDEPAEQAALRAPRIRRARRDPGRQLATDVADAARTALIQSPQGCRTTNTDVERDPTGRELAQLNPGTVNPVARSR